MNSEKLLLNCCGDPASVADYEAGGGYRALRRAVRTQPAQVIERLAAGRLVGRGGAAYPTAKKWSFVAGEKQKEKYVVANADEGEAGTFKDRVLLENDPLAVIEGMTLAGFAVGAQRGVLFLRGEYMQLKPGFEQAVSAARAAGLLGKGILGVEGFDFDITVTLSAGAYICGEETALLNAVEGRRGEPRLRPPYPTSQGLYGKPTLINNVETFAQAAAALAMETEEYLALGDGLSGGTKLVCLTGMVCNPGVYEIPLGKITLKELIESPAYGGGTVSGRPVQFYQLGGQSGPVGFAEQIYTPYGYDTLYEVGLGVGSGSIAVYDDTVSAVEYCAKVAQFFARESCGKCVPCRLGLNRAAALLEKGELDAAAELIGLIERSAACGLGQSAGRALKSFLKYRRQEFCACPGKEH